MPGIVGMRPLTPISPTRKRERSGGRSVLGLLLLHYDFEPVRVEDNALDEGCHVGRNNQGRDTRSKRCSLIVLATALPRGAQRRERCGDVRISGTPGSEEPQRLDEVPPGGFEIAMWNSAPNGRRRGCTTRQDRCATGFTRRPIHLWNGCYCIGDEIHKDRQADACADLLLQVFCVPRWVCGAVHALREPWCAGTAFVVPIDGGLFRSVLV